MKNLILALFIGATQLLSAQDSLQFNSTIGVMVPVDATIGMGVGVKASYHNFFLQYRYDVSLRLSNPNTFSPGYQGDGTSIEATNFSVQSYVDLGYKFKRHNFSAGWAYLSGTSSVYLYNNLYGYNGVSLAYGFGISQTATIQLRGNIPIKNEFQEVTMSNLGLASLGVFWSI